MIADRAVNHAGAHALPGGLAQRVGKVLGIDAKGNGINVPRHILEAAEAWEPENSFVCRMDRRDETFKA